MTRNTHIAKIWNDFRSELWSFVFSKVKSSYDTDDIVQDVFLKITLNYDAVVNARNIHGYIYAIVRNRITDHFRNNNNFDPTIEHPAILSDDDNDSLNYLIAANCMKPFIEALPEKYRQVLIMADLENVSQKEIAKRLNISYSGAKSRVQRGRQQLESLLKACCEFQSDCYGNISAIHKKSD